MELLEYLQIPKLHLSSDKCVIIIVRFFLNDCLMKNMFDLV